MQTKDIDINLIEKRHSLLEKRGVCDTIDMCYFPPRKYYRFEKKNTLSPDRDGKFSRIEGVILKIQKSIGKFGSYDTKINVGLNRDPKPEEILHITCHGKYMYDIHIDDLNKRVVVCGNIAIFNGYYCMMDPIKFSVDIVGYSHDWEVIFPKYSGISADWMKNLQDISFLHEKLLDTLPDYVRNQFEIPKRSDALLSLAKPKDLKSVQDGLKYRIIEDLMYFACVSERSAAKRQKESPYAISRNIKAKALLDIFPYSLTDDQESVIENIERTLLLGDCASELVQGDVGCGKSIVAFYLLTLIAENGYQGVLMAPTTILASQHFSEYQKYAKELGITVALLAGNQKATEKKAILNGLKDGSIDVVIGTHAVFSDSVSYKSLALVLVDEEHRFGVKQREKLTDRTKDGVHMVSFSATPIPRSLALALFNDKTIHEIKTMPSGRKPVLTKIVQDDDSAISFANIKIKEGQQVYVVCPLIDTQDNDFNLRSVKETAAYYKEKLGCEIGIITGQEGKGKNEETLSRFEGGEIQVLVATTVVEVGVNIPNATVMIIEDAFMFGLSQLHQLRGRVCRGNRQGYCILRSDRDSARLNIMCSTTDGFKIAEEDMRLRGAGNLIGIEQSGNNHYFQLALSYPNMFRKAKTLAKVMIKNGEDTFLTEEIERRSDKMNITKIRFYDTEA